MYIKFIAFVPQLNHSSSPIKFKLWKHAGTVFKYLKILRITILNKCEYIYT